MRPLVTVELKAIIESLLLVADGPVQPDRVALILEIELEQAKELLQELQEDYEGAQRGFSLQLVDGGFQFRTRPEYAEWIRRFRKSRPFRFSRAGLETLAIVAYRQPVTRAEIDYLRGVDSGGVIRTLLDKRLVRILGKKDIPGKPLIYGTSREFLELFGLRDLSCLPTLKEFNDLPPDMLADMEMSDAGQPPLEEDSSS
ncbi:SMC-Scp complex subunit ScpB [Syntrophotalea acetylenivorans]|uniref:SMC-Scp complex subunit ScpB n=1 Tax=Syntrophotalea acetylenivorans TaxID=1842532 RepID=A0A1L3GL63_9BACT|nr:SMC-Scp complex subunit ScpB [Syntrophotalea acetylenivorans]